MGLALGVGDERGVPVKGAAVVGGRGNVVLTIVWAVEIGAEGVAVEIDPACAAAIVVGEIELGVGVEEEDYVCGWCGLKRLSKTAYAILVTLSL